MNELPILSIIISLPLFSAAYISFFVSIGKTRESELRRQHAKYVAVLSSILTMICAIYLLMQFDSAGGYQFAENYEWLPSIGLNFSVAVDGLGVYLIFLTTVFTLICILSSMFTIKQQIKEFLLCFLFMEAFCIAAFCARNLMLFYINFELVLVPLYFIIGIWGGENRVYAAIKFFLYSFLGSVFFLLSVIYIFYHVGSLDMDWLASNISDVINPDTLHLLWIGIFIALAIKVPMLPLHSWLPDAHVQAPTPGSVMLAAILLKLGAFGMVKILLPIFPQSSKLFSFYIIALSVFAIIYASLVAIAQSNIKKIIAYSSIAHMGYVTAAMFSGSEGSLAAANFQMISHTITSGALFLIYGMLYERIGSNKIADYGGIAQKMPFLAMLFMVVVLASIGVPGTVGFIGELLSIIAIFKASIASALIALSAIVLSAVYMLRLYKKIMLGRFDDKKVTKVKKMYYYEVISLLPLVFLCIYFGLVPGVVLRVV